MTGRDPTTAAKQHSRSTHTHHVLDTGTPKHLHLPCGHNCASLQSRVSAQNCEALLVTQLAAALVADDPLGCKRLSSFGVTSVWHPTLGSRILISSTRGSGRARRPRKAPLLRLPSHLIRRIPGAYSMGFPFLGHSSSVSEIFLRLLVHLPNSMAPTMLLSSDSLSTIATCCKLRPELRQLSCVPCPKSTENQHTKKRSRERSKNRYCNML